MAGKGIPSSEVIREHAYLIARGARSLAFVGQCSAEPLTMVKVATKLERLAEAGALPFVLDQRDGHALYGYAGSSWALDLYRWVEQSQVPLIQRHRILGLLLGYSAEAIRCFEEMQDGRFFDPPPCTLLPQTEKPTRKAIASVARASK